MKNRNRLHLLTIILLLLPAAISQAKIQKVVTDTLKADTITLAQTERLSTDSVSIIQLLDSTISVPQEVENALDDMLHAWMLKYEESTDCTTDSIGPVFPDSVYKERLQTLPYVMEMPYNSRVRAFINLYVDKRRKYLGSMIGMYDYYAPMFEEKLNQYGLPLELSHLPIIESALNPSIVSRAGATGLWQFMVATGRMYGLEVNSLIDERCDPLKSTDAACRFLKDLYSIYGDWHLVIAAYNCGPGNVNKAIRRSGGKRDYWEIYPYLPRETRGYVPTFIGACYAMNFYQEHKICPKNVDMPLVVDTIMTGKRIHLEQIAAVLDMPIADLRALNPQYRRDIVPGNGKNYAICLPHNYALAFIDHEPEILAYKADELINNRRAEIDLAQKTDFDGSYTSGNITYYKVKAGNTLGGIAQRYHVTVSQLQKWNRLKGTTIRIGQTLKIYR